MTGHEAVLKREALEGLVVNESGTYVDCTYGRGGHAEQILERLNENGRMMVIDKDIEAINHANQRFAGDSRVTVMHGSFRHIKSFCEEAGFNEVDGIFIDLGISSPQIDQAERGFSFDRDGPLDMRMDKDSEMTALVWLEKADVGEISRVLKIYGEEKFSYRIAKAIKKSIEDNALSTTMDLSAIIDSCYPKKDSIKKNPSTKTFQAIRIFINKELEELEKILEDCLKIIEIGGRIVVISFHSLEDRIVKNFINQHALGKDIISKLPIANIDKNLKLKKIKIPLKATDQEIEENIRARSARIRVAEKI